MFWLGRDTTQFLSFYNINTMYLIFNTMYFSSLFIPLWHAQVNPHLREHFSSSKFESLNEIIKCDHFMKAMEQYFPVVLFIMLYKVVLTFEPMDEIL